MSSENSASPSGWASDELFVRRDVSIPPGTLCPAYLGYQQTLPANTRTFPDFCCQTQFAILQNTQMDTDPHNVQQRSIHVLEYNITGEQHTDGCSRAQVSSTLQTRRWQTTKIPPVSARVDSCLLRVAREKLVLLSVWLSIAAKLDLAGRRSMGTFFLVMLCSYPSAFGASYVANADSWYHQHLQSRIRGPSSLRHEKMDNARKALSRMSPTSWIGNGATG